MSAMALGGCLFIVPAPIFAEVPNQSVAVGAQLDIDLAPFASDPEDRPLTFSVTEGPGAIEDDSHYVFAPQDSDVGDIVVEVAATNGLKDDRARFTVTVTTP